ncbi:4164_t:CDS:2, partial [Racocetra fulgida]
LFHDFDSGIPVTDTAARMLQMSYILSSILSDDEKQKDMDRILGFVGMSPSNPSNVQVAIESKASNIASNTANSSDGLLTTT